MALTAQQQQELFKYVVGVFNGAPGGYIGELAALAEGPFGGNITALGVALANSSAFKGLSFAYSDASTNEQFTDAFLANLLGTTITGADLAWARGFVLGRIAAVGRAAAVVEAIDALAAVPADTPTWGAARTQFDNRVALAVDYTINQNGQSLDINVLQSVVAGAAPTTGETFNLTIGVDNVVGTAGNDTINGSDTTITGLDTINGALGVDTINVADVAGSKANLALLSVQGVENLSLTSTAGLLGAAADVSAWTGLTSAQFVLQNVAATQTVTAADTTAVVLSGTVSAAAGATVNGGSTVAVTLNNGGTANSGSTVTVNGGAATTAATVTQTVTGVGTAAGVAINDAVAADDTKAGTLATVTISGLTDAAATINSDALTTLNLTNSDQNVTIDNDTAKHSLTLNLNKVTGGTIADVVATSIAINATGANSTGLILDADLVTSITVAGDKTISMTVDQAALTSINAAANTAGVTIVNTLDTDVAFTGGAGKDSVSAAATTKAIDMGAGDDTVALTVTALGTDGSVLGGAGTDTLSMSAANAAIATADTKLAAAVKGFEVLQVGAVGAAATISIANLNAAGANAITEVVFGAVNAATTVAIASGNTVEFTAANSAATTIAVTDALLGAADVANISITAAAGTSVNGVTAANIETVNFLTDDTATTPTAIEHIANLTANEATTVTVAGDAGLTLNFTGTKATSFDASGVTKGDVSWTTGALAAAATITGGQGANNIDFSAATKAVTYTGAAGVDTVTTNDANNSITTGGGADVVTLGSGINTVDLGAGDDEITLGGNLNVVTLGDGDDVVLVVETINGNTYSTINDFAVGDEIDFGGIANGANAEDVLGNAVTLGGTAAFADFLAAATAGDGSTNSQVNWFQFGGDTYIVIDNSLEATFQNGSDSIVKLVGLVDLSEADLANDFVLTLATA